MTPTAEYLYTTNETAHFLKLNGHLTFDQCAGFEQFIQQIIKTPNFLPVIIDLREAHYLDSTNLGLLARLAAHSIEQINRKVTLLCQNPDVNHLLTSIGFEQIAVIISEYHESTPQLNDIPGITACDKETSRILLDAHRTLMNMNDTNRQIFSDVVTMLEDEK